MNLHVPGQIWVFWAAFYLLRLVPLPCPSHSLSAGDVGWRAVSLATWFLGISSCWDNSLDWVSSRVCRGQERGACVGLSAQTQGVSSSIICSETVCPSRDLSAFLQTQPLSQIKFALIFCHRPPFHHTLKTRSNPAIMSLVQVWLACSYQNAVLVRISLWPLLTCFCDSSVTGFPNCVISNSSVRNTESVRYVLFMHMCVGWFHLMSHYETDYGLLELSSLTRD